MLHYETIDSPTLELLKSLLSLPEFGSLRLAGGTSLALQYGHRKSIDIDLFGKWHVDEYSLISALQQFKGLTQVQNQPAIKTFIIQGIKVDIVNYPYPWIDETVVHEELRLAGTKDIAAMKLAAITGRGSKKDFIDLYFILKHYDLRELLEFYQQKYADGSVFMVLKSLVYFDDADEEADPIPLLVYNWQEVKEMILHVHRKYLNSLNR